MLEVRLHGPLAKEFGRVFRLDVRSPAEAVHAIASQRPAFRQAIMRLDRMGLVFRVRTRSHDFVEDELSLNLGASQRLDIIPIVRGAGARTRFIIGAVLFVASFWAGPAQPYVASIGLSLMLGSVVEWLTPVPKPATAGKGLQSWVINGPTNTVDQGNPVPVIYGEVLAGGYTVSAGIAAGPLTNNVAGSPSAIIGGDISGVAYRYELGQEQSLEMLLTAGSNGPNGPLNGPVYTWAVTGFVGATFTTTQEGTSLRIKVTSPPSSNPTDVFSATVTLSVVSTPYSGDQNTYHATTNTTVTALFGQPRW